MHEADGSSLCSDRDGHDSAGKTCSAASRHDTAFRPDTWNLSDLLRIDYAVERRIQGDSIVMRLLKASSSQSVS